MIDFDFPFNEADFRFEEPDGRTTWHAHPETVRVYNGGRLVAEIPRDEALRLARDVLAAMI